MRGLLEVESRTPTAGRMWAGALTRLRCLPRGGADPEHGCEARDVVGSGLHHWPKLR